jgi:NAD(P)-dependent dehydrogenase (short-subunit alcohol dehydrogenase family)
MTDFHGKVAVITGAASGIGRSTALLFAREGAKLHLSDIDADALAAVKDACEVRGVAVTTHIVDVADPDQVERFAAAVYEEDGGVDVLHNNAGVGHAGAVVDTRLEDWQKIINVNLMGVIHGVHFFVPRMLKQGRPAHIVNTASMAGLVANPKMAPYCTSKFGVVGLSESLDAELGPQGIHVTALCPGIIDTAIVDTTEMSGDFSQNAERLQHLYHTRGTSPDVVAEAVLRAIRRKHIIEPTPRWQVTPGWIMKRVSPRLSQITSRAGMRAMTK